MPTTGEPAAVVTANLVVWTHGVVLTLGDAGAWGRGHGAPPGTGQLGGNVVHFVCRVDL